MTSDRSARHYNSRQATSRKVTSTPLTPANWRIQVRYISIAISLVIGQVILAATPASALPPPEDTPEEVLRTEIITEARSPITGKPLTAAEYAELEAQQEQANPAPEVDSEIRRLIGLLRLRQAIRSVFPFLLK